MWSSWCGNMVALLTVAVATADSCCCNALSCVDVMLWLESSLLSSLEKEKEEEEEEFITRVTGESVKAVWALLDLVKEHERYTRLKTSVT